jgi:protein gp37
MPNVWLGFSAEDQETFDRRWLYMKQLAERGWTVFASLEPLLGPIVLPDDFLAFGARIQVIVGGESGPDARPMHPDWVRAIRMQCHTAGVPLFFKQWGGYIEAPAEERHGVLVELNGRHDAAHFQSIEERTRYSEEGSILMQHVGKKKAGRVLDGRTWDEYPFND